MARFQQVALWHKGLLERLGGKCQLPPAITLFEMSNFDGFHLDLGAARSLCKLVSGPLLHTSSRTTPRVDVWAAGLRGEIACARLGVILTQWKRAGRDNRKGEVDT